MSEIDYVYYNFLLYNDTDTNKIAEFNETREDAIIKDASDWDLAVVRFSIPSTTIPIFVWKPNLYYLGLGTNDGAGGIKMLTIEVELTIKNQIVPNGNNTENYVYNYQLWIDNLNAAMRALYINVNNGVPTPAGIDRRPIFYYNSPDDFGILFPEYDDAGGFFPFFPANTPANNPLTTLDEPKLYMSRALYSQFFPSLDSQFIDTLSLPNIFDITNVPTKLPMNYLIRATQRVDNFVLKETLYDIVYDVWVNKTQYLSQFAWTKVRRIILSSTSLQVNPEQIGASGKNGRPYFENILTDFELPIEHDGLNKTTIYYQPSVFRYISILSDSEIRKMDLRIYFQDYDTLNIFPLEIPPHHDVNVKLQFRRIKQNENLLTRLVSLLSTSKNQSDEIQPTDKLKQIESGYSVRLPEDYVAPSQNALKRRGGFMGIKY